MRIPGLRPVWHLLVICVAVLTWCLPVSALAQYRGGREMPEENYLGRKGYLFANASGFYAQPAHDYKDPTRADAAHGFGWKVSVGIWITSAVTAEFEVGGFGNDRKSRRHPFSGDIYPFITWMGYDNTFWQAIFRYHLRIEKRVIPYITLGGGRMDTSFLLDSTSGGFTQQVEMIDTDAFVLHFGFGANLVLVKHVMLGIDMGSMEWSTRSLIPGSEIWGVFRMGLNLSWHF